MRFVVYGAGAIGGGIGGRLAAAGHPVVLVARGPHLEALRTEGLRLREPTGSRVVPVDAVEHPSAVDWRAGDVVILAVKGQDTVGALLDLRDAVGSGELPPVVCAQNGVANEREALRRFPAVYGMCVMMPAVHLEPGQVRLYASPVAGNLDVGRYPSGVDALASGVAAALTEAGFSSFAVGDVMRWKYTKLLMNLGNAVQALCGPGAAAGDLHRKVRAEGEAVLRAAGIDFASPEEDAERRTTLVVPAPDDDGPRPGGSSWQSLARGTGTIETDLLNGEIVLLGRRHGVATPLNDRLQHLAVRAARERWAPGSLPVDEIDELTAGS